MATMALELKLRALRKRAGLSQAQLAQAVDVRIATISDLENDNSRRIEFDLMERLCKVLSSEIGELITPNDLFGPKRRGK